MSDLAEYKGCYKDEEDRDLEILISGKQRMSPIECYEAALASGNTAIKFVGLQYGGECWGSATFGKYGLVDDKECSNVCIKDPEVKCGGPWRNSIYDLSTFVSQKPDPCTEEPKDCSRKGGYDASDDCKQTCVADVKLEKCQANCFKV